MDSAYDPPPSSTFHSMRSELPLFKYTPAVEKVRIADVVTQSLIVSKI